MIIFGTTFYYKVNFCSYFLPFPSEVIIKITIQILEKKITIQISFIFFFTIVFIFRIKTLHFVNWKSYHNNSVTTWYKIDHTYCPTLKIGFKTLSNSNMWTYHTIPFIVPWWPANNNHRPSHQSSLSAHFPIVLPTAARHPQKWE